MKLRNKILFSIIYIIGIFVLFFPNNGIAQSYNDDIEYTFEKSIPYSNINNLTSINYNLRQKNENTEFFNASYSFTNDEIGSYPLGWIINDDSAGSIEVYDNLNGHSKVLELNDINSNLLDLELNIDLSTSGSIEYWFLTDDSTKKDYFQVMEGGTYHLQIYCSGGTFWYNDGGVHDTSFSMNNNEWYHIRIDFEAGAGGYLGLGADTYRFYINGIEFGDYSFHTVGNGVNRIWINTNGAQANYKGYYDAIGFSWLTNYTIGNNKYPIIDFFPDILTPDKYEFDLQSNGEPIDDIGSNSIVGWSKTGITTAIEPEYNEISNSYGIKMVGIGSEGSIRGFRNNSLNLRENINLTFGLRYIDSTELNSHLTVNIYSYDSTEVIRLRFDTRTVNSTTLQYYDGAYQDLEIIYGIINYESFYEFNLYLNDYSVNLMFYQNGIYNNTYTFDFLNDNIGVSNIEFNHKDDSINADYLDLWIEYIGIYEYNVSITKEFGYISYDLENDWYRQKYNLITINSNDILMIKIMENSFLFYDIVIDYKHYNVRGLYNTPIVNNIYGFSNFPIYNAWLLLMTKTEVNKSSLSFTIEGIKLTEGLNIYYPTYNFNNVNENFSYFYVQNNKLYHTLDITQAEIYENMTIFFDIDNVITVNKTYSFKSLYNGIGNSYAFLNYTDNTIELFSSFTRLSSVNYLLPQDKLISILSFMTSDLNNSGYTNYTSIGQFYDLKFRYIENIEFTITTILLINLMIPLILIMIPTLAISAKIGKIFIIPLFMFMLVISFIGQLIPIWLLLITEVSLITSFFIDKEGES